MNMIQIGIIIHLSIASWLDLAMQSEQLSAAGSRQKHGYGCTHVGPGCGYHTGAGAGQHWGTRAKTRTHGHGYSHPCVDVDYIT